MSIGLIQERLCISLRIFSKAADCNCKQCIMNEQMNACRMTCQAYHFSLYSRPSQQHGHFTKWKSESILSLSFWKALLSAFSVILIYLVANITITVNSINYSNSLFYLYIYLLPDSFFNETIIQKSPHRSTNYTVYFKYFASGYSGQFYSAVMNVSGVSGLFLFLCPPIDINENSIIISKAKHRQYRSRAWRSWFRKHSGGNDQRNRCFAAID